jgi:hypothetical protein
MTGAVSKIRSPEARILTACNNHQETEGKDGCNTNLLLHLHLELKDHVDGQTNGFGLLVQEQQTHNVYTH